MILTLLADIYLYFSQIMTNFKKRRRPALKTDTDDNEERIRDRDSYINNLSWVFRRKPAPKTFQSNQSQVKDVTVKVINIKLSEGQRTSFGVKHRAKRKKAPPNQSATRLVPVKLVQDSECEFFIDQLIVKAKLSRLKKSTVWLRPNKTENSDDYGIDQKFEDVLKDDEGKPKREVPVWARAGSTDLRKGLALTGSLDPDLIFGECDPPNLDMLFVVGRGRRNIWSSYSSVEGCWDKE